MSYIGVKLRRMSFAQLVFCLFPSFFLTNYNTFFYILGYKPRDTTSAGHKLGYRGQKMTDVVGRPGDFFRVFLSLFQLNSCFFSPLF